MLPLIVFVTPSPRATAPINSVNTAMQQAARSVRLPEPTLVANELATSLDPAREEASPAHARLPCTQLTRHATTSGGGRTNTEGVCRGEHQAKSQDVPVLVRRDITPVAHRAARESFDLCFAAAFPEVVYKI